MIQRSLAPVSVASLSLLMVCGVYGATNPVDDGVSKSNHTTMTQREDAQQTGVLAVIYGLPLVMMELTKQNFVNAPAPRGAPLNQFLQVRRFPTAAFKQIVRANVDTLYSSAFLDLAAEPLVLSIPDSPGRYYLLPVFDAWTNVFATPGTRTTGDKAADYLIAGPDWNGRAPTGLNPEISDQHGMDSRPHSDQRAG